ncbi:neogenin-like [Amphiura filiformis]|uniref:neogenin-like n=1 Tax=Amphiura filiformis TaxID=82378 RepID=UPI003B21E39C
MRCVCVNVPLGAAMFVIEVRVPDEPPQNLQCDNSTRYILEFIWTPPPQESQNGIIRFYEYQFGIDVSNKHDIEEGNVTETIKLFSNLEDSPNQVRNLSVVATSESSLVARWNPPRRINLCKIRHYFIQVTLVDYDHCNQTDLPALAATTDNTQYVIDSLKAYSLYIVSVHAYVGQLAGDSVELLESTLESAPLGSPSCLGVDSSIKEQLTFSWELPYCGKRNGKIDQFEYEFGMSGHNYNTTDLFVTFNNLEHFTEYVFRVRAWTIMGPGPFSEWQTGRTAESAPDDVPQNITSDNSILQELIMSWLPPPKEHQNGIITMYIYKFNGISNSTTDPTVTFTNLAHCTAYEFTVKAFTAVGGGPLTKPKTAWTLHTGINGHEFIYG